MNYPNNNNNFQQPNWSYPRQVIKKAMTKARTNKDGNGSNRGILIVDPQTQAERWININSINEVCKLQNGSYCYFAGEGNRPSLTVSQQTPLTNQSVADTYSRQAHSQLHGEALPQFDNNNNGASPNIEQRCQSISSIYIALRGYLSDVSEENLTKMAISIYISISKEGEAIQPLDNLPRNMPF